MVVEASTLAPGGGGSLDWAPASVGSRNTLELKLDHLCPKLE